MQKADEEAAKVYEEFVESFKSENDGGRQPKQFVRGGTVLPGSKPSEGERGRVGSGWTVGGRRVALLPTVGKRSGLLSSGNWRRSWEWFFYGGLYAAPQTVASPGS